MKERIKRFYNEHKTQIVLTSVALVAAVAVHSRSIHGHDIDTVDYLVDEEGKGRILVWKENGDLRAFSKRPIA